LQILEHLKEQSLQLLSKQTLLNLICYVSGQTRHNYGAAIMTIMIQ